MGLALDCVKIVVGGTNGKGSTCAMLDAILRAAGYRVGRYGSPHLLHFCERALIDGAPAQEAALIAQLQAVERARGDVTLTYFEFTTLAVLALFAQARLDVAVLEVGLGGRLDAVNIVDADCAVVTTVALDHTDLLGPTREHIGLEKAHIFRTGVPAICVDPDPPAALLAHAHRIGAPLWRLGEDFSVEVPGGPSLARQWTYRGRRTDRAHDRMSLPWPALRGAHQLRNAAGALAALDALAARLLVDQQAVRRGLAGVQLAGRFQVMAGRPALILDVAHNPHAARALAQALAAHAAAAPPRALHAVFGMLRDKDAHAVVEAIGSAITHWHLVPLLGARGRGAAELAQTAFAPGMPAPLSLHASVADALDGLLGMGAKPLHPDDRIVVFGSFLTVAAVLAATQSRVS